MINYYIILVLLKKGSIFLIQYDDGKYLKIIGDKFIFKSAERTKIKFKEKFTLHIK